MLLTFTCCFFISKVECVKKKTFWVTKIFTEEPWRNDCLREVTWNSTFFLKKNDIFKNIHSQCTLSLTPCKGVEKGCIGNKWVKNAQMHETHVTQLSCWGVIQLLNALKSSLSLGDLAWSRMITYCLWKNYIQMFTREKS